MDVEQLVLRDLESVVHEHVVVVHPLGDLAGRDAAFTTLLAPGSYTVQVAGSGGGTGVALVEVYELP